MGNELKIVQNSNIRNLTVSNNTLGYRFQLGVEIGALESFFSFEKQTLGAAKQTNTAFEVLDSSWSFDADIDFEKANVHVSERGNVDGRSGQRVLMIKALRHSSLMDSVLRFIIPKEQIKEARIGNTVIRHKRRNRYHQFPADSVQLTLWNGSVLRFTPDEMCLPKGFTPVVYLRDEPDDWILHFRALALHPSEYLLKGCTRWYNRPFPQVLQRLVFFAFPNLRQTLLFVRERVSQRIPIQVNGASPINTDEILLLGVRWAVEDA